MKQETKITLSAKELELVCNTEWILTKHAVIDKVYELFGDQATFMQYYVEKEKGLPQEISIIAPKISKGENYGKLPYVMLDYPRYFDKENTLAIRTMFWWGNFFSIHLQLSGKFKQNVLITLQNSFEELQQNDYWVCISDDPWQHHFGTDNYLLLKECSQEQFSSVINSEPFVKLGKKISLTQWNEAPKFIERSFIELLALLKINSPGDEKDPLPGIPITGSDL